MPNILLTNHYSAKPLEIIQREVPKGFELSTLDNVCKEELIERAVKADYFLVSGRVPIDRDVIDAAGRLKMIQRTGVGIEMLDTQTLKEKGIPVYVNRGVNAGSVAEHTLMLILSVLRRLSVLDASVKSGQWRKQELGVQCCELNNKTVGLVGIGNIGAMVARLLVAFGARVLYYDVIRLTDEKESELDLTYCPLSELLREVDILSIHCPLIPATKGMIGSKQIALMKTESIIVNTSRGRLIDEAALIDALRSGHIKGAGLDVFSEEPLSNTSPLLRLDNVILTPHVAGVTYEAFQSMMSGAMHNIKLFEEGKAALLEEKKLVL